MTRNLICNLLGHNIGAWKYHERKGLCFRMRSCSRCDYIEELQSQHTYGDWTREKGKTCKEYRICRNCGFRDTRALECVGVLTPHDHEMCSAEIKCQRCGRVMQIGREHDWAAWAYIKQDSCEQERPCGRCRKRQTRVLACVWGDWQSLNSCVLQRVCQRCGKVHQTVQHEWGQWASAGDKSCERVRSCPRCGEVQRQPVEHQWGSWLFAAHGTCDKVRECLRCGEREKHKAQSDDHQWTEGRWVHLDDSTCGQEQVCARCGTRSVRSKERHNFEFDHASSNAPSEDGPDCIRTWRCTRCGATYTERRSHTWFVTERYPMSDNRYGERRECRYCHTYEHFVVRGG